MSDQAFAEEARNEAALALRKHLYERTAKSKVTGRKPLLMAPPIEVEKETLVSLLDSIGTEDAHPALANSAFIKGKKDMYYYDGSIMTRHYAEIDSMLEDKDILHTIASVTRSDCKLYPRPTQYSKLMDVPFRFSKDEIAGAAARMQTEEAYQDIGVVTASNGKSAFFSETHMSRRYAQSLIEKIEVEDPENP